MLETLLQYRDLALLAVVALLLAAPRLSALPWRRWFSTAKSKVTTGGDAYEAIRHYEAVVKFLDAQGEGESMKEVHPRVWHALGRSILPEGVRIEGAED